MAAKIAPALCAFIAPKFAAPLKSLVLLKPAQDGEGSEGSGSEGSEGSGSEGSEGSEGTEGSETTPKHKKPKASKVVKAAVKAVSFAKPAGKAVQMRKDTMKSMSHLNSMIGHAIAPELSEDLQKKIKNSVEVIKYIKNNMHNMDVHTFRESAMQLTNVWREQTGETHIKTFMHVPPCACFKLASTSPTGHTYSWTLKKSG
jgi:hypothetical protein